MYSTQMLVEIYNKHVLTSLVIFKQGYAYFTSENAAEGWILSKKSVEDPLSVPGRILSPLYNKKNSDDLVKNVLLLCNF